ncbi:LDH2 family malate/lactate/ureidoglycolate dehydrogenase [Bradyrhizobium sp. F1.4.3]|uniref:Ldh family oxidoreductase n=1 Tax=Bradyrhizobium sp. F1.4.3 TaxID=3156356 RepID=UPI0033981593
MQEWSTTAVTGGRWGFGVRANAKESNVAACTVVNQSHVGRLTACSVMPASAGMVGLAAANSGRLRKYIAPFGGGDARLGTNPIFIAVPPNLNTLFLLDPATWQLLLESLELAIARGEAIPNG